ncbi:MAG: hypothetical protein ACR2RB_12270 [Gammaproteobacteria bacterium]
MRTTITLEEDVATRLHKRARLQGKSFKAVVNDTLRAGLDAPDHLRASKPFRVKARPLGLREGYSFDNVAELLEALDEP